MVYWRSAPVGIWPRSVTGDGWATHSLQVGEFRLSCTVWFGVGLPCRRLSAGWRLWTEISAIRWATCLLCATSEQHVRRSILRGGWAACMEWAAVQFTWHCTMLTVFNAHLKTHLFSISCGATAHLWHLWFLCAAYKCTYLLLTYSIQKPTMFKIWSMLR